jgi:predicted SAM-dependent methyltransferase
VRTFLRELLKSLYLEDFARAQLYGFRLLWRRLRGVDRRIKQRYVAANSVRRLHIGCGSNILEGWLNSDYFPHSASVIHLDATRRFPFEDNTFDSVFTEHTIEHFNFSEGLGLLSECYRILRHGGKIRLSTPDFLFLKGLYEEDKSDLQKEYIQWASDNYLEFTPYCDAIFVINNFVRAWGHKFIYDGRALRFSLETAHFKNIKRCDLNQSDNEEFQNLENEGRLPAGYLKLESVVLEGTKE